MEPELQTDEFGNSWRLDFVRQAFHPLTGVSTLIRVTLDALSLTRACRKMANSRLKERKETLSVPSPIFLWERGGRGCLSFFSALFNFCKLRFSETHTLTLSLVRERASDISSLAYSMHRTFKRETVFRQSLVRERASEGVIFLASGLVLAKALLL